MRLRYKLEEQSQAEWEGLRTVLERDCMPYIKQLKGCKSLLTRGSKKNTSGNIEKFTQRQDRRPLLIRDSYLHESMDMYSEEFWGFKARSTSAFTTNKEHNARVYGRPYLFFPIGNFKYAWNDKVTELYKMYDNWIMMWNRTYRDTNQNATSGLDEIDEYEAKERTFEQYLVPELEKYKTNNLNALMKQSGETQGFSEAIVNCKTYYLVTPDWRPTLKAWFGDRYWR